jgi:AcrR family transcriptional regulator
MEKKATGVTHTGETRRDRHIQRQRGEILAAAAAAFAIRGYTNTTIKDIALKADLAEGTIYNYFENKRDILLTIAAHQTKAIDHIFQESIQVNTPDDLVSLVEKAFEVLLSQSGYTRILIAESLVDDEFLNRYVLARLQKSLRFIQDFIAARTASKEFRPYDPSLAARIFLSAFIGLILPALRGGEPIPGREEQRHMAETLVRFFAFGILENTPA